MKGILGRKLGMTQVFTEDGLLIPVTVVEATPNVVLQQKTLENDAYVATQLGFEDQKQQRSTKAEIGHAQKAGASAKKFVREIRGTDFADLELGSEVKVDIFAAGELVDVTAISKGKGFTGAVKRNNQHLGPASHGSGHHRGIGSLATIGRNNGVVNKGRIIAGREGHKKTTIKNLEVIKVDLERSVLLIKGAVPGPKGCLVTVKNAKSNKKAREAVTLVDYSKEEKVNG